MCGGKKRDGSIGEEIAVGYLKLAGYRILARNYRSGHLELDIIASREDCLVFVEVKTRKSRSFGGAAESISAEKIRNMRRAARRYLSGGITGGNIREFRFDAVTIDIESFKGKMVVRHIKGFQ